MAAWTRACVYLLSLLLTAHAAGLICPFGKFLSQCNYECSPVCGGGSECPDGCSVDQLTCNTCAAGCFCPNGLQEFGEICLPQEMCPAIDPEKVQPQDNCSRYETCNDCISADPDCQWCPYQPGENSVIGTRCRVRDANPVCPVPIEDPRPSVENITDNDFDQNTQVRPQQLRLQIRAGEPLEFTLRFRPSENFPLDVYFLLDVTGSFSLLFRDTVTDLAANLVGALQNISDSYAVAFGGFGDKRAIPYALPSDNESTYHTGVGGMDTCTSNDIPLPDCNPTISFRHTTSFSRLSPDELRSVLGNISIHLNVDALEGGTDGLAQVLTCTDTIGWRNPSLRMLLYMSNAPFHLAGDGKMGAAFQPNPGQCSLVNRTEDGMTFAEYLDDTIYDYPSVYQLRDLVRSSETNVIFAVTSEDDTGDNPLLLKLYQELVDEIGPFSRVVALEQNSANIVQVIQEAYNEISQEVRLTLSEDIPGLEFKFTPGEGCASDDVDVCTNVSIGKTVSFDVSVTMAECLPEMIISARLQSPAFGNVMLEIVPLCDCSCNANITEEAEVCNGTGDLVCGQCQCLSGTGDMCQCDTDVTPTCGNGPDGLECSGPSRGYCDCGTCKCFIQQELLEQRNFTEPYFGEFCECDHLTACGGNLTENGQLCSGRGECSCTECTCTAVEPKTELNYAGDICECDPSICYSEEHQDVCVYTGSLMGLANADCDPCDGCQCNSRATKGPDGTCEPICAANEPCARCAKDLQSDGTDCQMLIRDGCTAMIYTTDDTPDGQRCTFRDDENCEHTFYVQTTTSILVDDDRVCGGSGGISNLAWIIPVAVIVGLLVLGGIILLIVLLIVCINDRLEYSHFKKDLEDANWDQLENPMYVSPQTQYSNITYKPKKPQTASATQE